MLVYQILGTILVLSVSGILVCLVADGINPRPSWVPPVGVCAVITTFATLVVGVLCKLWGV